MIGCNTLQKGVFNPIPEDSKIGLLPAKTDVASAQFRRSDWLAATWKKGSSIRLVDEHPNLVTVK